MPEIVFDPLGRRRVLLAPERARRGAPKPQPDQPDPAPCDFCPGREDRTPPEIERVEAPDGWRARAFRNLYPATDVHEVVVHTPDHAARFEDLPPDHRRAVLHLYARRVREAGTAAVVVSMNRGRRAGASRSHDHGQLFGLPFVPPTLERESSAFAEGRCVLCRMREEAEPVAVCDDDAVIAHPAPLVAHELLVVPPHRPDFDGGGAGALAEALRRSLAAFGEVGYNLVVHTAPRDARDFHWHAHLYPRLATWGALELGAEVPVVAAHPRDTTELLRSSPGPVIPG